jgi:hypothetical protein
MMNLTTLVLVLLLIANGINCIVIASIIQYVLFKTGKRKSFFAISKFSDFTDFVIFVRSEIAFKKYKGLVIYAKISMICELLLLLTLLLIMSFN